MHLLEVVAIGILTLKVPNTSGRPKHQFEAIANVGGLDLSLDMAIIALVHAIHEFCFGVKCKGSNKGEEEHEIIIKARGIGILLLQC